MSDIIDLSSVQEARKAQGGILRIISKAGNVSQAYVPDGLKAYESLIEALRISNAATWYSIAKDERGNDIPFCVVINDVSAVFLMPPPSGLAIPSPVIVPPTRGH